MSDFKHYGDEFVDMLNDVAPTETGTYLRDMFYAGALDPGTLAKVIGTAWSRSTQPTEQVPRNKWRRLFDLAGYTDGAQLALRPRARVRVYRGSLSAGRDGLGWTTRRDVAERYPVAEQGAGVFTLHCSPRRLLAHITPENIGANDEDEYVIDARGLWLQIRRVG